MNRITFTAIILLLIVAIALAWTTDHYHGNAVRYKDQRDTATHNLKLANETITDMTKRQRDVAALDAKYTKELADAKAENDALRGDVAADAHIKLGIQPSGQRLGAMDSALSLHAVPSWRLPFPLRHQVHR